MLSPRDREPLDELDRFIFDQVVAPEHYLRRTLLVVDFERFWDQMAPCYSADMGRPAEDPVLMLKLEFLQYHDNLSDRKVIERAKTDMSYRQFLGLPLSGTLPDPSLLTYFRGRLGADTHQQIFDGLVAQARDHGLVKDRLRLKDATHVIANIAIPSTIQLIAQTRMKLLDAVKPFDSLRTVGEQVRAEMIRAADEGLSLDVLSANGCETASATCLLEHEEAVHGNDVEALSIDGVGFDGAKLAEWTDPEGLNLEVFVPTRKEYETEHFPANEFVEDETGEALVCPAEQKSHRRNRNENNTGWMYRFHKATCATCPLHPQCVKSLKYKGRTVNKYDYAAHYAAAREKATTEPYRQVRREHWAVERKLAQLVCFHGGRRARSRSQPKVRIQQLLTGFVVNTKRMVRLLSSCTGQPE